MKLTRSVKLTRTVTAIRRSSSQARHAQAPHARLRRVAALWPLCAAALVAALPYALLPHPAGAQAERVRAARGERARESYFPAPGDAWERRPAGAVGMDSARLAAAVAFALASESRTPRDLEMAHYQTFGRREPLSAPIGPFRERGAPTGIVLRRGYIVAEWGDPRRVDMTFSVTKSFLSSTVGVAFDRGLLRLDDTVANVMPPILSLDARTNSAERLGAPTMLDLFPTARDRTITWDNLLRQTSDWEGTLWGKPDWADRPGAVPAEWTTRQRAAPGTTWKYNDVRVNVLALAALNVWRRPLPAVLREYVMDPIGASSTWRWYGYENSWIVLDAEAVQSVSGGGHWGGGMFISARDMARFGLLTLRRGRWRDRQLLSDEWVRRALTPTGPQPTYGFMNWFLNTDRKRWPYAPATAFAHIGNGTNIIYVDPEHDLVAVVRWIDDAAVDGFLERLLASLPD